MATRTPVVSGVAATAAGALLGLLAFVVLGELLMRALPVSTATKMGYHVHPDIPTYAPHHDWRYATGWDLRNPQRLRTNNQGFVAEHDFVPDPTAVGLIGDSYVESASVAAPDRLGAQLERALAATRRPVYAMGSPGTALLDHVERIRYAHERFGVRDFVMLLDRGDVRQAVCEGGGVSSNRCLDLATSQVRAARMPEASAAKRLLRESALAQYLASQLKITPGGLWRQAFGTPAPAPASPPRAAVESLREVDAVSDVFFEQTRPHARRLVIVIDSDRQALMRGEPVDDPARRRFIERARATGATVVDTEPIFRAHFARSPLSLDIGPYDGHFNPLAMGLIADAAARALAPVAAASSAMPATR